MKHYWGLKVVAVGGIIIFGGCCYMGCCPPGWFGGADDSDEVIKKDKYAVKPIYKSIMRGGSPDRVID
jgi:hypothetical protein